MTMQISKTISFEVTSLRKSKDLRCVEDQSGVLIGSLNQ